MNGPHDPASASADAALSANVATFCALLRRDHGFGIGQAEAHDALRALTLIGIGDKDRARTALRLVCCASPEQRSTFDRAFDAFFDGSRPGVAQSVYAPRHTRSGPDTPSASTDAPRRTTAAPDDDGAKETARRSRGLERRALDDLPPDVDAWQALRSRYSPVAAHGTQPAHDAGRAAEMRLAAQRLLRAVQLGRARRRVPATRGDRFDIRRTLRASLATGGDPVALRFLGHPHRNPRFVVLIDGSRSMAEHSAAAIAFAAALCDRWARAHAFVFSTALRDVTRDLRAAMHAGSDLRELGAAWGGGTKIGANLAHFVADYGARVLSPESLVIIFSDGLDAGDIPQLEGAMREIDRRSAGIVWLNPHAAASGFTPTSRGMRAALPSIALLCAANDAAGFERLARRVAQTPRIRGRP